MGKKSKRKDRGSESSGKSVGTKSPAAKKHNRTRLVDDFSGTDESDSESDSDTEEDVLDMLKVLSKQFKEQKKLF